MSDVEETKEDEITMHSDEGEEVGSSAELEEKKRIVNESQVSNNTTDLLLNVQNLYGTIVLGERKAVTSNALVTEKKYALQNIDECVAFIEEHKDSEYLAVAMILSVFEAVALSDLPDLVRQLMDYLPESEVQHKDENEYGNKQSKYNPYISLNSILSIINGEQFTAEDGRLYVSLGKHAKQVLVNIAGQFPALHQIMTEWLIHLHEVFSYHTSFDAYQMVAALSRIISIDIIDAKVHVFSRLYTNPNNAGLLGNLAYRLFKEAALKDEVASIIIHWIQSSSIWLWKAACLAYTFLMEDDEEISFENKLKSKVCERILMFEGVEVSFFARLMMQSKYFRTLWAAALSDAFDQASTREKRIDVAHLYIRVERHCYYQVSDFYVEMPLIACDTKQQQIYLAPIVKQVMVNYYLRRQLYAILGAYLRELSTYNFSENTINHISAFLHNMISGDIGYQQDVLYFVSQQKNKAATQIYKRLCSIYRERDICIHE